MDEETARKIADHCLEPVKNELGTYQYQQVKDRIKTQLIIAHRKGAVKNWEKGNGALEDRHELTGFKRKEVQ